MLSYRATLDVPIATVRTVSGWLTAYRRAHDICPHQRACTTWGQAWRVLHTGYRRPPETFPKPSPQPSDSYSHTPHE